jgi:hypothetical protein
LPKKRASIALPKNVSSIKKHSTKNNQRRQVQQRLSALQKNNKKNGTYKI